MRYTYEYKILFNAMNLKFLGIPEYAGHNGARRPRKWCSQTA